MAHTEPMEEIEQHERPSCAHALQIEGSDCRWGLTARLEGAIPMGPEELRVHEACE